MINFLCKNICRITPETLKKVPLKGLPKITNVGELVQTIWAVFMLRLLKCGRILTIKSAVSA